MPLSGTQEGGSLLMVDAARYSENNTPASTSVPAQGGQSPAARDPLDPTRQMSDGCGLSLAGRATTPYLLWDGSDRIVVAYRPCEGLVLERNKDAIYAIYNRALRADPALQGKVVLELKIAPGGEVAGLRIVSSELKADELEKKLLARIRGFDFRAKDVEAMVVNWPVDFLPS